MKKSLYCESDELRKWLVEQCCAANSLNEEDVRTLVREYKSPLGFNVLFSYALAHGFHKSLLFSLSSSKHLLSKMRPAWKLKPYAGDSVELLLEALKEANSESEAELVRWLGEFDDVRVQSLMLGYLKNRKFENAALNYLKSHCTEKTALELGRLLSNQHVKVRRTAAQILIYSAK